MTVFNSNKKKYIPTKKDRECFYTLCPLFFASTAFVVTNALVEIFCFAKCEIMFCRTLLNISLCSM